MNLVKAMFTRDKQDSLSIVKDPFQGVCVNGVRMVWLRISGGKVLIYSNVSFQNGSTKGEQEINADSMDELITKTKAFLESLPKKGQ